MSTDKVRENRLRRVAERQGLRLEKSRRRDPLALDYGTWRIVDPGTSALLYARADLDGIEHWLTSPEARDDRRAHAS